MTTVLAEQDDVEVMLGRSLTTAESNRVDALLAAASARFRAEAGGRDFSAGTASTVLRVVDGKVQLPQRPVTSVTSVTSIGTDGSAGAAIGTWSWDGLWTVSVGDWWSVQINAPAVAEDAWSDTVQVAYSYGFAAVPDDVRYAVASMVSRSLATSAAGTGVESETIGGYSYRLGSAAGAGALGMTADESRIARRYRRSTVTSVALG